jgi:hypothetical protein
VFNCFNKGTTLRLVPGSDIEVLYGTTCRTPDGTKKYVQLTRPL